MYNITVYCLTSLSSSSTDAVLLPEKRRMKAVVEKHPLTNSSAETRPTRIRLDRQRGRNGAKAIEASRESEFSNLTPRL